MKKDYKVLKTPEEMTEKEKKENNISDYVEEGSNGTFSTYEFLYDLGGAIGAIFFTIFFGAAGFFTIFSKDVDSDTKIVGSIFAIGSIFIAYKGICYIKAIVQMLKNKKEKKSFVITIGSLGYALITIPISLLIISIFLSALTTLDIAIKFLNYSPIILTICGVLGTVLIYVDLGLSEAHKNNVIIGKKK